MAFDERWLAIPGYAAGKRIEKWSIFNQAVVNFLPMAET